jgi:hypothetical protein
MRLEENGVVPRARTDGQTDVRQTDMMKLIFAFGNFENAPRNHYEGLSLRYGIQL